LLLEPVRDHAHLLIEVAAQHDAVVDDGRDPVEQHALRAELGALAVRHRRDQKQGGQQ